MARVGFMVVTDHRTVDYVQAGPILQRCVPALQEAGLQVEVWESLVTDEHSGVEAARSLQSRGLDCIIYYIAWFFESNTVVTPAMTVPLPAIVWSEPDPSTYSLIGMGVIHGSLREVGVAHRFIYRPVEERTIREIATYARAAATKRRLWGARYCQIGGRCLSMYTGVTDPAQWKMQFGVEVEHMDQWELVLRADRIAPAAARDFVRSIRARFRHVETADDVIEKSGRVYLALRAIFQEGRFDFAGLKCQFEMIDNYVAPCLAIALLNDEGLVTACEADMNAALSMSVLSSLSGKPAMFCDTSYIDRQGSMIRLLNCGTAATHFAPVAEEVRLMNCPNLMGSVDPDTGQHRTKGGVCTNFVCRSGEVTLCRFARRSGRYVLQIAQGEAYQPGSDDPTDVLLFDTWPWAFVRLHADMDRFIDNLGSNHIHMAYGSLREDLTAFCELTGVEPVVC